VLGSYDVCTAHSACCAVCCVRADITVAVSFENGGWFTYNWKSAKLDSAWALTAGLGSTVPLGPAVTRLAASSAQRAALSPRAWSDRPRSLGRATSDRPVQHSAHSPSHCAARLLRPSSGWLGQARAASAGGAVGCMDRCDRSPCLALPLSVECAPFPLRTSYSASSSSPLQPQSAAVHAA
jgi:hypothetical protein